MECISVGYNDADLWMLVWNKVDECIDEWFNIRVVCIEPHTTLEEGNNDP